MTPETSPHTAASATPPSPCPNERYGASPQAHEAVRTFADRVGTIVGQAEAGDVAREVAAAMKPVLETPDLLCAEHREGSDETYRKHILYADPEHRFTLLALIWHAGQGTVIHGHTAWGAVGVYEGTPNVAVYDCVENADGTHTAREAKDVRCEPGDTATVDAGLGDVHRIYNASDEDVVTLHMYGCDLVEDPDAINLYLNLAS